MGLQTRLSERWHRLASQEGPTLQAEFAALGYLYRRNFLDEGTLRSLRAIWESLKNSTMRKEVAIEYGGISSPRRMFTVSAVRIDNATEQIDRLYRDAFILETLTQITNETIQPLNDSIEKYVINWLAFEGDRHGAHVDSFPFACSYVLEAPPREKGGTLIISDTPVEALSCRGKAFTLSGGDLFFFRSDTLYHQVSPLLKDGNRIVLNMAYATPQTESLLSYSRNSLYS